MVERWLLSAFSKLPGNLPQGILVKHSKRKLLSQGGLGARNPNQGIRMFRHGSRSFSPAVHGRLRGVRRESHRQRGTEKSDSISGV